MDDLFKKFFPDQIGQSLLVNFTERGYELIICDNKNFLNFLYKPYSKSLQSIEQLDDEELGSTLPGLAMASALHETQYSRLFRS